MSYWKKTKSGIGGITILLITHDIAVIGKYVNRVIYIGDKSTYELSKDEIAQEILYRHRSPNRNNKERYLNE